MQGIYFYSVLSGFVHRADKKRKRGIKEVTAGAACIFHAIAAQTSATLRGVELAFIE